LIQSLIMFCYSGALTSFLIFNFKKRIFLGDNGSMSLGVVIAFGVFSVITATHNSNLIGETGYFINNASVIVLALISFPFWKHPFNCGIHDCHYWNCFGIKVLGYYKPFLWDVIFILFYLSYQESVKREFITQK